MDVSDFPPFDDDVAREDSWDEPVDHTPAAPAPLQVSVSRTEALSELRDLLASQDGATPESAGEFFAHVHASGERVLALLGEDLQRTYAGVFECLLAECASRTGGRLDLSALRLRRLYDADVQDELSAIAEQSAGLNPSLRADPLAAWTALNERVQRMRAVRSASRYVEEIKAKRPLSRLLEVFRSIEPPTNRRAELLTVELPTAHSVYQATLAASAGRPTIRLSSGLPTLDRAFTGVGDAPGLIALGEGALIAAATGSGKSSFSYTLVPALVQDVVNWGFKDGKVLFLHTEEETAIKLRSMEFLPGQKHRHLADNLVIDMVGTSRTRIAELLYSTVIAAQRRASETNRPITDFLPYAVVLDYLQSIMERGENEVQATSTTSSFLFRGVQSWNPDEMAKFSGLDFRTYAGFAWPSGMEHHRVACFTFAQLVKQDDKSLYYKAGARGVSLSDFSLEDTRANPAWTAPDGSSWAWEVKEGDARILMRNAIRGSGTVAQDQTAIVFLHRSRPINNPSELVNGRYHLRDTRARFILDKTRNGSSLPYVPALFDVDEHGYRARFYDELAEVALAQGRLRVANSYSQRGDLMLPVRDAISPLAGWRY